jgi:hypothetical protein
MNPIKGEGLKLKKEQLAIKETGCPFTVFVAYAMGIMLL